MYMCALERNMVCYDIKAFAVEKLGMNSWKDSDEDWNKIFSKTVGVVPYLNGMTSWIRIVNDDVFWLTMW